MHRHSSSPSSARFAGGVLRPALISLAALALLASAAHAQLARVAITVTDLDGTPLQGVQVTATNDDRNFSEGKTTSKKGVVKFGFIDGTVPYLFKFESEGYITLDVQLKPQVGLSMKRTYQLQKPGEVAIDQVDSSDAAAAAAAAPKKRYSASELAFNAGVEALKTEDYATAEAKFREALGLDAELIEAHSALASVYVEMEKGPEALASAQAFVAAEPENPRSYRLLYEAHRLVGNSDEADAALKKMSKLQGGGDAAALRYNEGLAALRVGDYKAAEEQLKAALEAKPDLYDAMHALTLLSINQKDYEQAAAMAESYLAAKPGDPTILKIRWEAYSALEDTEKAKMAFEELSAVDPKVVVKQLFEAAQNDFNAGNTDQAIARLDQLLQIQPEHPGALYQLGLCWVNKGDNAKAKQYLNQFVEVAPNDPQAPAARDMMQYLG